MSRVELANGKAVWMITALDDVRQILAHPAMSNDRRAHANALMTLSEEERAKLFDERARAGQMLAMDPPEHTRLRRMVVGQFTLRRMRSLTPRITEIVDERLDAMEAGGTSADLVPAFSLPVPSLVICELLGVPYDARETFQRVTSQLVRLNTPIDELVRGRRQLRRFMDELVETKRTQPDDDLISGLIRDDKDVGLTHDELVGIANLLLVAGHETTANMIALGTFVLLEHPQQLARLRDDPSVTDDAVEELLRYLSIIHLGPSRVATSDVELGGVTIKTGETVLIAIPQANRDPARWDDPDRLDLGRARSAHVAFGHGVHQCLGQQLARAEMAVALPALLRRFPHLRLAVPAEEVPMRSDMVVYGVHSLPVKWDTPAPGGHRRSRGR
ncbi:cytochrome P450 [Pseudonocardia terrae]|uniref:cytochrome P450 n=1 Tax=Pseudonocardia terrae TaxID=2905831 RepID=UPI0027E04A46|nr:cytochrome P450 [Pseudonocardia terrae]